MMKLRSLLFVLLLLIIGLQGTALSAELLEKQLDRGIKNTDPYSYMLMEKAAKNPSESKTLLDAAASYSPDLPEVYFRLARHNFATQTFMQSVTNILQGIDAASRNFIWSLSFLGSVLFSLILSFTAAFGLIVGLRLFSDSALIAHDIKETPLLAVLLAAALASAFTGPILFIASALFLIGFYMKKTDKAVVYAFFMLLICSPVAFNIASLFLKAASSGKLAAVRDVNEGRDNLYAIELLKDDKDFTEAFSYALALKREGRYEEAITAYRKLADGTNPDPRVLVNLGNCYVGLYNFDEGKRQFLEEAVKLYLSAVEIRPLASAYYNLSQISRELLDFSKGGQYFQSAVSLNRGLVSSYGAFASRHPNRLVADETLSSSDLWGLALKQRGGSSAFGLSIVKPGLIAGLGLFFLGGFVLINLRMSQPAYRCKKCDSVLCPRCETRLVWGQMCPQCYSSLVKLDELDAKGRVARLLAIYDKQGRRRTQLRIMSFLLPGFAHIVAGRILFGLLLLWPFLFFTVLPFIHRFAAPANAVTAGWFISWASFGAAVIIYVASNIISRRRIAKGWL